MFTKLFRKAVKAAAKPNYRKVVSWDPMGPPKAGVYAPTTKRRPVAPPGRKSIPLSPIEGMPSGGAGEVARKKTTDFGSPWGGLRKFFSRGGQKAAKLPTARDAQRAFAVEREALASELAPTEFLKQQKYTIRTPESGNVTIRAGASEVTFGMIGGELLPEMVTTVKAHRGQGIASYMYRIAEEATGMRISTKATKTEAGAAFVAKRRYKELNLSALRAKQAVKETRIGLAMQSSTDMVKANTTGMTVGGLAQHPRRGGSRQGRQGGTG